MSELKLHWFKDFSNDGNFKASFNDDAETFSIHDHRKNKLSKNNFLLFHNQIFKGSFVALRSAQRAADKIFLDIILNNKKIGREEILKNAVEHALKIELANLEDIKMDASLAASHNWNNPKYKLLRNKIEESADYGACISNIELYKKALKTYEEEE